MHWFRNAFSQCQAYAGLDIGESAGLDRAELCGHICEGFNAALAGWRDSMTGPAIDCILCWPITHWVLRQTRVSDNHDVPHSPQQLLDRCLSLCPAALQQLLGPTGPTALTVSPHRLRQLVLKGITSIASQHMQGTAAILSQLAGQAAFDPQQVMQVLPAIKRVVGFQWIWSGTQSLGVTSAHSWAQWGMASTAVLCW